MALSYAGREELNLALRSGVRGGRSDPGRSGPIECPPHESVRVTHADRRVL